MRQNKPEYDEIDISSAAFWSLDAVRRDISFAVLRGERPVSWHRPLPGSPESDVGFWAIVRHRDIVEASRRSQVLVGEDLPVGTGDATQSLRVLDPPFGSRTGPLISSVFTARRVERLEQQIRSRAKRIIDAVTPVGEIEFVEAVSSRLGAGTVADMFGVPEVWRDEIATTGNPTQALQEHARSLIEARRSQPRDDVMSALVSAEAEGQRLTDEEIVAIFVRTWVAQCELTRQTASHAMKALCDFPGQRRKLLADFENGIYPAIEEFLRWATPVMTSRRRAVVDLEISGQHIAAGDVVVLVYASANRDEAAFADPHLFDVTRSPNHHVALGSGAAGLGHHLVRTQLQALFTELLYRLPDLQLGPARYGTGSAIHSIERLPATFTAVGGVVPAPREPQLPNARTPR